MADEKGDAYVRDAEKEAIPREDGARPSMTHVEHSKDADEAMKAFAGVDGEQLVLDEATSKRLLRKIDLHIMPVGFDVGVPGRLCAETISLDSWTETTAAVYCLRSELSGQ